MLGNGQSLEEKIADRINQSSLGINVREPVNGPDQGVYVNNPYDVINPDRATRFGKHPKGTAPEPAYSADLLIPDLDWKKAITLNFDRDRIPSYEARTNIYLDWGAERAVKQPFVGVCESFNCVVIAILMARNSPLDAGTVVEYIGVKQGALGHAIAVINRNNATENIGDVVPAPQNWGAHCIVVDQWYALQAGTGPVFHAAGLEVNRAYVDFLNTDTTRIDVRGRFTASPDRPPIQLRK